VNRYIYKINGKFYEYEGMVKFMNKDYVVLSSKEDDYNIMVDDDKFISVVELIKK